MQDRRVVVKIDFRNALNSLRRDLMLRSVASTVSGIYWFCRLSYNQSSVLRFENRTLLSQEGPHQCDSLGPLLFCVSIHPDLLGLQSELVAGFIDELTLGGPSDKVAADIDYFRDREQRTGLRINASKSEIICRGSTPRPEQFDGFISLAPDEADLLGAPRFTGKRMDTALTNRCTELNTAVGRLPQSSIFTHSGQSIIQRT